MDIGAPPVSCIVLNLVLKKELTSQEILTVGHVMTLYFGPVGGGLKNEWAGWAQDLGRD